MEIEKDVVSRKLVHGSGVGSKSHNVLLFRPFNIGIQKQFIQILTQAVYLQPGSAKHYDLKNTGGFYLTFFSLRIFVSLKYLAGKKSLATIPEFPEWITWQEIKSADCIRLKRSYQSGCENDLVQ